MSPATLLSRVWQEPRFRQLSERARLLLLSLIAHPHLTTFGALHGTWPGIAAEMDCRPGRLKSAIDELTTAGMVIACSDSKLIWLPEYLTWTTPTPTECTAWPITWSRLWPGPVREQIGLVLLRYLSHHAPAAAAELAPRLQRETQAANPAPRSAEDAGTAATTIHALQPDAPPESGSTASNPTVPRSPAVVPPQSVKSNRDSVAQDQQLKSTGPAMPTAAACGVTLAPVDPRQKDPVPDVPESLQTPEFLAIWKRWVELCQSDPHPVTTEGFCRQLNILKNWGVHAAVKALNDSIASGQIGTFSHTTIVPSTKSEPPESHLTNLPTLSHRR